jgi:hypothetical protein
MAHRGLMTHPSYPSSGVANGGAKDEQNEAKKATLKDKEEGSWEFAPARVPDGISLRNFGIQVVSVVVARHISSSVVFVLSHLIFDFESCTSDILFTPCDHPGVLRPVYPEPLTSQRVSARPIECCPLHCRS